MAHVRQYTNCGVIRIDAGMARGYDKRVAYGQMVGAGPKTVAVQAAHFFSGVQGRLAKGGPPIANPSTKYLDEVEDQLEKIRANGVGGVLLTKLNGAGQAITITYPEIQFAIRNKCAGSSSATTRSGGTPLYRKPYDEDSRANQLHAFQQAYQAAGLRGVTDKNIADAINDAIDATTTQGASNATHVTTQNITDWMAGTVNLPPKENTHFAYLLWVFERDLTRGTGNASRISFDPWNWLSGPSRREPFVGLFHELVHAWHNATGRKLFSDDDLENEMMTVGLAPFDQVALGGNARKYTENLFRAGVPLPLRQNL